MESAVEFLFRRYLDNKQNLTLADFVEAMSIEENNIDELIKKIEDGKDNG